MKYWKALQNCSTPVEKAKVEPDGVLMLGRGTYYHSQEKGRGGGRPHKTGSGSSKQQRRSSSKQPRQAPLTPNLARTGKPEWVHSPFEQWEDLDDANTMRRWGRAKLWPTILAPQQQAGAFLKELRQPTSKLWDPGAWHEADRRPLLAAVFRVLAVAGNSVHNKWRFVPAAISKTWDDAVQKLAIGLSLPQPVVENALLVIFPLSIDGVDGLLATSPCVTIKGAPTHLLSKTGETREPEQLEGARIVKALSSGGEGGEGELAGVHVKWFNEYPQVYLGQSTGEGRKVTVNLPLHRFVLWVYDGMPRTDGTSSAPTTQRVAMHLCGCSACINPRHVYWGSKSQNGKMDGDRRVTRNVLARSGRVKEEEECKLADLVACVLPPPVPAEGGQGGGGLPDVMESKRDWCTWFATLT
jgi:hypothetical protein